MKINTLKKTIYLGLIGSIFISQSSFAEIWCNQGTVVQIGDVFWNESSIIANYPGLVPDDIPLWVVGNVDMHITFEASHNYADGFAGGGGGFGGYSVSNSGEVKVIAYAPHNYITAPGLYNINEGVKFKMHKCYTIPPMTAVEVLREFALPWRPGLSGDPVAIKPLNGIDTIVQYWSQNQATNR